MTDSYVDNGPSIWSNAEIYNADENGVSYFIPLETGIFDNWSACFVFNIDSNPWYPARVTIGWQPEIFYGQVAVSYNICNYYVPGSQEIALERFNTEISPTASWTENYTP
jgi:hypothetical protein